VVELARRTAPATLSLAIQAFVKAQLIRTNYDVRATCGKARWWAMMHRCAPTSPASRGGLWP
jgi:hypothetical protein